MEKLSTGVHGAGGGWGRNLTAESGAVQCGLRQNWSEKFAYFVIRGKHQPVPGYLVIWSWICHGHCPGLPTP